MTTSIACNTIPPVVSTDYTVKGKWITIGELAVYATGPTTSAAALIGIYDIYGASSQALQGADILASALNILVLVPDFFKGEPMKHEWSVKSEENDAAKAKWGAEKVDIPRNVEDLLSIVKEAKTTYPGVKSWGAYGLCWGGKLAVVASGLDTPFKVTGQVHPGRLAAADVHALTIPHIMLASKDEDPGVVGEYAETLKEGNSTGKIGYVETYPTMHHGWMGARADLKREDNLAEYKRGYQKLAEYFAKYL